VEHHGLQHRHSQQKERHTHHQADQSPHAFPTLSPKRNLCCMRRKARAAGAQECDARSEARRGAYSPLTPRSSRLATNPVPCSPTHGVVVIQLAPLTGKDGIGGWKMSAPRGCPFSNSPLTPEPPNNTIGTEGFVQA
jgi:hypothetical protein